MFFKLLHQWFDEATVILIVFPFRIKLDKLKALMSMLF